MTINNGNKQLSKMIHFVFNSKQLQMQHDLLDRSS